MQANTKFLLLLMLSFSFSCRTKEHCCGFTIDELVNSPTNRVNLVDTNRSTFEYQDIPVDSFIRGSYVFYGNRQLKEYDFLIDNKTSIYREQFDSSGKLMYKFGEPLIFKSAQSLLDSIVVKFYFFSLNKSFSYVHFISDKKTLHELKLKDDTLFSNSKAVNLIVPNARSKQRIKGVLRVKYFDSCGGGHNDFSDTLDLLIGGGVIQNTR